MPAVTKHKNSVIKYNQLQETEKRFNAYLNPIPMQTHLGYVSYKEVERMQSDLGLLVFSCREPQMVWSQAATRQRAPPASHSGMVREVGRQKRGEQYPKNISFI